jgi:hypothetical protein
MNGMRFRTHSFSEAEVENMTFKMVFLTTLAILMVVTLPLRGLTAEQEAVVPSREWSGSIDDLSLMNAAPEFILSAKEFENLWLAWNLLGSLPEIDFSTDLVAVQTTQGSKLRLSVALDDQGNLKVLGLATRDLRPGFRYVIAVLSRKGVKTIKGKEFINKADQTSIKTSSAQDLSAFGILEGIEVQSVQTLDPNKLNAEISQAFSKGEIWPKESVLVALKFVGEGLKGNTKIIDVRTPPETQETATITITESGYLDDAIRGERWRLWLVKKADGTWIINRALWAQLCDRPGRRFYSARKCP